MPQQTKTLASMLTNIGSRITVVSANLVTFKVSNRAFNYRTDLHAFTENVFGSQKVVPAEEVRSVVESLAAAA
jgi:Mrp family chromosome partitioning ATPase